MLNVRQTLSAALVFFASAWLNAAFAQAVPASAGPDGGYCLSTQSLTTGLNAQQRELRAMEQRLALAVRYRSPEALRLRDLVLELRAMEAATQRSLQESQACKPPVISAPAPPAP